MIDHPSRHDSGMTDDDLRYRVAHPTAPRVNAPDSDDGTAPRTPPEPEPASHVGGIVRALHGALVRHGGGGRVLDLSRRRALDFDATEAVKTYLAANRIVVPNLRVRFSMTPRIDTRFDPLFEVGLGGGEPVNIQELARRLPTSERC